jgi:hypothetical protein
LTFIFCKEDGDTENEQVIIVFLIILSSFGFLSAKGKEHVAKKKAYNSIPGKVVICGICKDV